MADLNSTDTENAARLQHLSNFVVPVTILTCFVVLVCSVPVGAWKKQSARYALVLITLEMIDAGLLDTTHLIIGLPVLCFIGGILDQFFAVATWMWTSCIATNLVLTLYSAYYFRRKTSFISEKKEIIFHVATWTVALTFTLPSLITHEIGPADYWCWIIGTTLGQDLRLFTFFGPLWVSIVYVLLCYVGVIVLFVKTRRAVPAQFEQQTSKEKKRVVRLMMYPLVFLLGWIFPTIARVVEFMSGKTEYWLLVCGLFSVALRGFCHAVICAKNLKFDKMITRCKAKHGWEPIN